MYPRSNDAAPRALAVALTVCAVQAVPALAWAQVQDAEMPGSHRPAAPPTPGPQAGFAAPPPPAPAPDAQGRVPFAVRARDGKTPATLAVSADRPWVQVWIDGRYYGYAPLVIAGVPVGDYIVEGIGPDGATLSKAVGLVEGEAASVVLQGRAALAAQEAARRDAGQPGSLSRTTYVVGAVTAACLLGTVGSGLLTINKQDEYDSAPLASPADEQHLVELAQQGRQLALLTNALALTTAVGVAATSYLAWRDLRAGESSRPRTTAQAGPTLSAGPGVVGLGYWSRF